jgi:hypothetical protein
MEGRDFRAASFAPYIAGHRPLLVRGLAPLLAPLLVQEWSKDNFRSKFGELRFATAPVGSADLLGMQQTHNASIADFMDQVIFRPADQNTGRSSADRSSSADGLAEDYVFANDFVRSHPTLAGKITRNQKSLRPHYLL